MTLMLQHFSFVLTTLRCCNRLWLILALCCGASTLYAQAASAPASPATTTAPGSATPRTPSTPALSLPEVPEFGAVVEPASVPVNYKESVGTAILRLTNTSKADRTLRVSFGKIQLKDGSAVARPSLPDYGTADAADVPVEAGKTIEVKIRVENLLNLGTYEGSVLVRTVGVPFAETSRPLQIVRAAPSFDLAFSGNEVANGALTLKPNSKKDTEFSILVENPKTASEVVLQVSVVENFSGESSSEETDKKSSFFAWLKSWQGTPVIKVTPESNFKLLPAGSETVRISLANFPSSGDFSARLKFQDANSGAVKWMDVHIQPSFISRWDWFYIIGLVILGAGLSAVVGAAIPNLISRSKLWARISDMRQVLSALPASEQPSKGALARVLQQVDEMVDEADWYTPSAATRLAELDKKAMELEQRVALLGEVSDQRVVTESDIDIPTSARSRLSRELDSVATAAAKASLDVAREKLKVTIDEIGLAQASSDIRTGLDLGLASLPVAAPLGSDASLAARLVRLKNDHSILGAAPPRIQLLELDYQCQCAQLYFNRYLHDVLSVNPGSQPLINAGADLVNLLSRGKSDFLSAVALVESLQAGVTKSQLDIALADLPISAKVIVSPAKPKGADLVTFRLAFNDDALNKSPLLRSVSIRWTFSAGASEGFGPIVGQHFNTRRYEQTVAYQVSVGPGPKQQLVGSLTIPKHPFLGGFVTRAEAVSFCITLAGAILLALIAKYTELRPLQTVQDYINPFLLGFGLDRMKALVSSRNA